MLISLHDNQAVSVLTPPLHRPVDVAPFSTLRDTQSGLLDYAAVELRGLSPSPTPAPMPVAPVVPVDGVTAGFIKTITGTPATEDVDTQLAVSTSGRTVNLCYGRGMHLD